MNYEVTGANVWKHASSLATMAGGIRRFYLNAMNSDHAYRLNQQKDAHNGTSDLKVDLADRSDADRKVPGGGVLDTDADTWNGIEFISDPLMKSPRSERSVFRPARLCYEQERF